MESKFIDTRSFRLIKSGVYIAVSWMLLMRFSLLLNGWVSQGARMILIFLAGTACFVLLWYLERQLKKCSENSRFSFYSLVLTVAALYGMMLFTETRKSVLWLVLAPFLYIVIKKCLGMAIPGRIRLTADLTGCFFALAILLGSEANNFDEIVLLNTKEHTIYEILMQVFSCVCLSAFLCVVISALLHYLCRQKCENSKQSSHLRSYTLYFAGILLLWLPYYIAFYPGILDKDSLSEISQQLGLESLSNHHPIMHQMVIRLGLKAGSMFGSLELGVGLYTALQMILMASVFALCLYELKMRGAGRRILTVVFLFFSVFTVNPFFVTTMWKDVLFGGTAVLLSILLLRLTDKETDRQKRKAIPALLVVGFLYSTIRNNGFYAFIIGILVIALLNKRIRKELLIVLVGVILLVSGYQHLLFDGLGVKKSRTAEALSVPLQQIARVVTFAEVDLSDENFTILQEVFPDIEELKTDYISIISDPVKHENVFESEVFDKDPVRYLKAWGRIGLQHPRAYLEAFLLQNYGYWYPDVDYTIVYPRLRENELGIEANKTFAPLRENLLYMHEELSKRQPTAVLYSVGLVVWVLMISGLVLILKGYKEKAEVIAVPMALWLTTLASPVFCEYRYIYGVITSVPLFLCLAIQLSSKNNELGT